jgi:hypothetical protein
MEKEYKVEITETLQRVVTVMAPDADEAYHLVRHMYKTAEVVLDAEDFMDVDICVLEEVENQEVENEDEIVDAE